MKKVYKVLIVDDQEVTLKMLKLILEGEEGMTDQFQVVTALDSKQALEALGNTVINAALIDMNLVGERGQDVAAVVSSVDPNAVILLMTANPNNFNQPIPESYVHLVKTSSGKHMAAVIRQAIHERNMPRALRLRRAEIRSSLLAGTIRESIGSLHRQPGGADSHGDWEKLNGIISDDKTSAKVAWTVYRLNEHNPESFTIGVASSIGCIGKCKFCRHGSQKLIRGLTPDEIVCQVLYGLDSYLARGIFDVPKIISPSVNFTSEGEPFANLDNVMEAIRLLSEVEEMGFEFIITSIGLLSKLKIFLERYVDVFPKVRHYWSLNSVDHSKRAEIMPHTACCDLEATRDIYQEIAVRTGSPVTASIILIPGLNDSDADVEGLARLLGNRPFDIKLQSFHGSPDFHPFPEASKEQLEAFQEKLIRAGMTCRIRYVVGGESLAGCGSTVGGEYPAPAGFDHKK